MNNNSDKKRKTGLPRLIQIAGSKRWLLFGAMFFAVITSAAQFVPFVSVYKILETLAANAANPSLIDSDAVWHWAFVALWAFVIFGVTNFLSLMFSHIAAFNILYELRMQLARKLVKLPLGFFTKRASGDIKKVMSDDVERIELFVAHHIPDIVSAVVFPLILAAYMFVVDWRLALIVTAVLIAALMIMAAMMSGKKIQKLYDYYLGIIGKMNGSMVEYVRGIQVVKVFNRSIKTYEQLNHDINFYRRFSISMAKSYAPTYLSFYLLLSSVILFVIPVATWLLIRADSYTAYVPTVMLFMLFSVGIFFPVLKLMWIGSFMKQNTVGVGLIDEILDKPELPEPAKSEQPQNASVEFRNVSFAYNADRETLSDISFTAMPGTVTALVGPSGAGKSTIAMLTARFWDVSDGHIRIGGIPIKNISTADLMDHIAFVFQDNMLFFDTIEENIRMGNKRATFQQVQQAAKAAQCHEFIEKLENGYQTRVGEGGTYLSGGEAQRVALARAILKDAPIVLLDEATAYADPENEGKILDSFARLIEGRTVLVIAHRLNTITNADQILYIDNGAIEERGTHAELLAKGGSYARMWDTFLQSRNWVIGQNQTKNSHTDKGGVL